MATRNTQRATCNRRRGMTSVLAMLYLVLFGTLALGFYAAVNTQSQVVANDERIARSFLAAESGMDFMKYQLARVSIPPTTPPDQVIDELETDLLNAMADTGNLGTYTIARNGNTITIPAETNGMIKLDSAGNAGFRATITDWAGEIVVKIDGRYAGTESAAGRSITMDFTRQERTTTAFDYAVASKGQIVMRKGAVTAVTGVDPRIAQMMSALGTDPAIDVSGGTIGGDLSIIEGAGVNVRGGSVGGSSVPAVILANHVHQVEPPEFPTIDTSVYRQYAVNNYVPGARTQQNILIRAGTNPRFNGGDTVQGIMSIEAPNTVTFRGNFNLQGFIVFENAGSDSTNRLDFSGNVLMSPPPAGPEFDALRATSGVAILAPTASVAMSGSSDSYIRGNVIVSRFSFNGSADIQIDRGTIMTYSEAPNSAYFNGKTVKFTATGAGNTPTAGISYSSYFKPDPTSYQEVLP